MPSVTYSLFLHVLNKANLKEKKHFCLFKLWSNFM